MPGNWTGAMCSLSPPLRKCCRTTSSGWYNRVGLAIAPGRIDARGDGQGAACLVGAARQQHHLLYADCGTKQDLYGEPGALAQTTVSATRRYGDGQIPGRGRDNGQLPKL